MILVLLGGAVTLAAWLYARHADEPISDVFPAAFYIAAAGVGVFAVVDGTCGRGAAAGTTERSGRRR